MKKFRLKLLHLHRCRGATRSLIKRMISVDPDLAGLYDYTLSDFREYFSLSDKRAVVLFQDLHSPRILAALLDDLRTFQALTIFDQTFPPLLRNIKDCPIVLYVCGNADLLSHTPSISVVGTRNPTNTAYAKMNTIMTPLIKDGWLIVSGMAMGIDGIAHRLAMDSGGETIAVLGGGFRHIYPKQHNYMFQELAETQLVVSEYPPGFPPQRYYFPERNRIISGLTFGTLVVEAKERSGSLITVEQALDQGKEVFAIPGSPLQPEAAGCNKMIQDGAKLVQNTYDILEEWK
ncbi:DNA-processing protein DprA [Virgibacillus senegalensis]|uniref:DNA-processing protein DprA n=1 Tax=Virgibacillus senegalensis TaxID=1499679 RepID=UPI00069F4911|nr:DNA-processing protein DprA [Virgibacillus senegalensis]